MSDTSAPTTEISEEDIRAGKRTVPSFANTVHKLIDRVLPGHTWEGELAHESVDKEYPEAAQAAADAAAASAPPVPVDARDARIADLEAQLTAQIAAQRTPDPPLVQS